MEAIKISAIRKLLDAIRRVETGGYPNEGRDAVGDGGKALGPYQIWEVYWKDGTNFDKSIGGNYNDVKKKEYAEKVIRAYWRRYCPRAYNAPSKPENLEIMARIHNGGPSGHKRAGTLPYWKKVQSYFPVNPVSSQPRGLTRPSPNSTNIWFGLGGSYGGHFFVIGKTSGHAVLFSADDYHNNFVMTTENWRVGPGLGGSWGISFMVITSMSHPTELNSATGSGCDFTIGLGARWGEVVKKLKYSPTVKRIIERAQQAQDAARNPITKQLLKLSFADWMSIKGRIKELVDAIGMKTDDTKPNLMSIGIPVPFSALEVSAYWGFSTYSVEAMSREIRRR